MEKIFAFDGKETRNFLTTRFSRLIAQTKLRCSQDEFIYI